MGFLYQAGTPIVVEGRLWGALTVGLGVSLPPDTGPRLERFTELIATAIANIESREALRELADEQAALNRVATLVAEGAEPAALFAAVTKEVEHLFVAVSPSVLPSIIRFDAGPEFVLVGTSKDQLKLPLGSRWGPKNLYASTRVFLSGASVSVEAAEVLAARGPDSELLQEQGFLYQVGSPIIVEGQLWGAMTINSTDELPPDTGKRLEKFTDLVVTAIANADTRDQLTASRVRLLREADHARRRVVRDLHDGAQQRLVHSIITLKLAHRALRGTDGEAATLVDEALAHAEQGNVELRDLAHGILPAALTSGGLRAGVDTLLPRMDLPVETDITDERFTAEIEASAYFIVAEALTNVVKHAHASSAKVKAWVEDGELHVDVVDDGAGGADPSGHGLIGLSDRATALGGSLAVVAPPSGGTAVSATFPL